MKISIENLRATIEQMHFSNQGDAFEQQYWPVFKERFPRVEEFWRWCIVPATHRIEHIAGGPDIDKREVSGDLRAITFRHYSAFLHFVYAYERLRRVKEPWALVEFYSHLGSVCDLGEDFLTEVHLFVLSCRGQESIVLSELTRAEFLELAGEWYDQSYEGLYQNYLAKGKGLPVNLPSRKSLVREYLGRKDQGWRQYQDFAQPLRAYRNFLVHDLVLGEIRIGDSIRLIPKKERLSAYKKLDQVFAVARDPARVKQDFITAEEQMAADFASLQTVLNVVWERPLRDFTSLLYEERNESIVRKYGFELCEGI